MRSKQFLVVLLSNGTLFFIAPIPCFRYKILSLSLSLSLSEPLNGGWNNFQLVIVKILGPLEFLRERNMEE